MKRLVAFLAFTVLLAAGQALACSDAMLPGGGGTANVVSARTMDFNLQFGSQLAFVPRKMSWQSFLYGKKWTNDYAFVGVNVFPWWRVSPDLQRSFCDGMNEEGLSAAVLWLSTSKYPDTSDIPFEKAVFIMDMVGYILGKFKTARAVYDAFAATDPEALPWFVPFHLGSYDFRTPEHVVVHDANNETVVLEWIDGSVKAHIWTSWQIDDRYADAMTNDPNYGTHLENLKTFGALHPDITSVDPWDDYYGYFREGEGMSGLPGDHTPRSRFVRLNYLGKTATQTAPPDSNVDPGLWRVIQAFRLINHVDGIVGEMYHNDFGPYFFTLWTVVRDHTNRRFYYTGTRDQSVKKVDVLEEKKNRKNFEIIAPLDHPVDQSRMGTANAASDLYGTVTSQGAAITLTINTAIPEESLGKRGKVFIYAVMPDGSIRYWSGNRWGAMRGDNLRPAFQGKLKNMTFNVALSGAAGSWEGAVFYCGYGPDVADMFLNGAVMAVQEMPGNTQTAKGGRP